MRCHAFHSARVKSSLCFRFLQSLVCILIASMSTTCIASFVKLETNSSPGTFKNVSVVRYHTLLLVAGMYDRQVTWGGGSTNSSHKEEHRPLTKTDTGTKDGRSKPSTGRPSASPPGRTVEEATATRSSTTSHSKVTRSEDVADNVTHGGNESLKEIPLHNVNTLGNAPVVVAATTRVKMWVNTMHAFVGGTSRGLRKNSFSGNCTCLQNPRCECSSTRMKRRGGQGGLRQSPTR